MSELRNFPAYDTNGAGFSLYFMRNLGLVYVLVCSLGLPATSAPLRQSGQSQATGRPGKRKKASRTGENVIAKPTETASDKPLEKKVDYSQEAFVIEQLRSSYRFESDGTGRRESIARIRVQSEAGVQHWGQLQVGYNSSNHRVEIPYFRVLKEDATIVKAGDDAVQDLSAPLEREAPVYTDYRQKHITVPGLRPGEVLEYDLVTVVHTPLAAGQFWSEYNFDQNNIVLDEQFDG